MKQTTKKGNKMYSFDEYQKKFSPPSPSKEPKVKKTPFELGVKLADDSLAKVRQRIRQPLA